MALKNIFNILVDLKIVRSINQPLVTQNDSVVFILEVMDDGIPFDLTETTTMTLAHTRRDRTVVVTPGTKEGNKVTFELGTNETSVAGGVVAKAQFYDATGRVSTLSFGYQVGEDPTGSGYVPSEVEQTLIQVVMADNQTFMADAQAKIDELSAVDVVVLNQQLADTATGVFSKYVFDTTRTTNIKFVGDSITAATNPGWVNKLQAYLTTNAPHVTTQNVGVGGMSSKYFNANKTTIISNNEDIVFVQLGTNDRWDTANVNEAKAELESFLAYVKARCNLLIVMTAPPAVTDGATGMNFGMKEVDQYVTTICQENGYFHISNYRDMFKYADAKGIHYTEMLEVGGSHPIASGYTFLYENVAEKLKLPISNLTVGRRLPKNSVNGATPPSYFPVGTSECVVDASVTGFPTASGGLVRTRKVGGTERFTFQEFYSKLETYRFIRFTQSTDAWTATWVPIGSFNLKGITNATDRSTLPIGVYTSVVLDGNATGMPRNKGGVLLTYKLDANMEFMREVYFTWDKNEQWQRSYTGGAMSYWEKVTFSLSEVVSGDFGTISAGTVKSVTMPTINIMDVGYYAITATPKTMFDVNLILGYSFQSTKNAYIKFFNAGATDLVVGVLEFNLILIKK